MRITILLALAVVVTSCINSSSYREELEGIWIYEPKPFSGDTVYSSIEDNFTDTTRHLTVRKLDTGLFVFEQLNETVVSSEPYQDHHACSFKFDSDTTGTISYFTFNSELGKSKYSFYDTLVQHFNISKGNLYCMITSTPDRVDVTMIDQFHKDSLLFIPTSNMKTVFHRYKSSNIR